MRDSIGLVGVFQIVLLFILLFTGIMALTINNSNAFGVKDEIVNIIDFNSGNFIDANEELSEEIMDAIEGNSYRNTGRCAEGYLGFDRNGSRTDNAASVCIQCVKVTDNLNKYIVDHIPTADFNTSSSNGLVGYFFRVQVFYQLDIPVMKDAFNFNTKGESKIFYSKLENVPQFCR